MTCPAMMFLSISAVLALLHGQADAVELDLGTRFPAMPNEEIVVRNDGGVRNETHSFAFGETCHSDSDLKTWFIVGRLSESMCWLSSNAFGQSSETHARTAQKPVNPWPRHAHG